MIHNSVAWTLLAVAAFSLGFAAWMNIYHPIHRPEEVRPVRNVSTVIILAVAFLVFYPAMLAVNAYTRLRLKLERRDLWQAPPSMPELPPAPEAPTVPKEFRPRKHKAVKDRIAWRKVHPREAEAIARQARQLHYHEQEEAELREASR